MDHNNLCYSCFSPSLSLVFVIGGTGSMAEEILKTSTYSVAIVNKGQGSTSPFNYILSTFNDPGIITQHGAGFFVLWDVYVITSNLYISYYERACANDMCYSTQFNERQYNCMFMYVLEYRKHSKKNLDGHSKEQTPVSKCHGVKSSALIKIFMFTETRVFVTMSGVEIKKQLQSLKAHGSGDYPEMVLHGMVNGEKYFFS